MQPDHNVYNSTTSPAQRMSGENVHFSTEEQRTNTPYHTPRDVYPYIQPHNRGSNSEARDTQIVTRNASYPPALVSTLNSHEEPQPNQSVGIMELLACQEEVGSRRRDSLNENRAAQEQKREERHSAQASNQAQEEDIKYPVQESSQEQGGYLEHMMRSMAISAESTSNSANQVQQSSVGEATNSNAIRSTTDPAPRYPDYIDEQARKTSFDHSGWQNNNAPSIQNLVESGFFYTRISDLVRCFQCGIGLKDFSPDDDPLKEHMRYSKECTFLRDTLTSDRKQALLQAIEREDNNQPRQQLPYHPRTPKYRTLESRLASFNNPQHPWPQYPSPYQMAEAGLYYTGIEDQVRCFCCDGGLKRWDPDDDPWIEHARWFSECPFVIETKGRDFIQFVQMSSELGDEEASNTDQEPAQSRSGLPPVLTPEVKANVRDLLGERGAATVENHFVILRGRGYKQPTGAEVQQYIFDNLNKLMRFYTSDKAQEATINNNETDPLLKLNKQFKLQISCPHCFCEYTHARGQWLLLPCRHFFCGNCLESKGMLRDNDEKRLEPVQPVTKPCPDVDCGYVVEEIAQVFLV